MFSNHEFKGKLVSAFCILFKILVIYFKVIQAE